MADTKNEKLIKTQPVGDYFVISGKTFPAKQALIDGGATFVDAKAANPPSMPDGVLEAGNKLSGNGKFWFVSAANWYTIAPKLGQAGFVFDNAPAQEAEERKVMADKQKEKPEEKSNVVFFQHRAPDVFVQSTDTNVHNMLKNLGAYGEDESGGAMLPGNKFEKFAETLTLFDYQLSEIPEPKAPAIETEQNAGVSGELFSSNLSDSKQRMVCVLIVAPPQSLGSIINKLESLADAELDGFFQNGKVVGNSKN